MNPRVLRIRRQAKLLTAQAYEEVFERQFPTIADVTFAPLEAWCDAVLGPAEAPFDLDAAASQFAVAVAGFDLFCPSYECIPLAPLLVALRNRSGASVRLLLIAHAAAAYAFEWALLRPLLEPRDVIIAPTDSARRAIEYLCPELAPNIRAIPHPMAPLGPAARRTRQRRIASLGRIHAQKLSHRLIESMTLMPRAVHLDIAGPLDDGGWDGPHPYTRMLREKVRRLGLGDRVRFIGSVRGNANKRDFLCRADAVINLSIAVEESFGKTPIEALGLGVPVVVTDWDGLPETVGGCGGLVRVQPSTDIMGVVDVHPRAVADAITSVLDAPPPIDTCTAWAEHFDPRVVLPRYAAALDEATTATVKTIAWPDLGEAATPTAGLIADSAALANLGWCELFDQYLPWCHLVRRAWGGPIYAPPNDGARVRTMLLDAVEPSLKLHFAGLPGPSPLAGRAARARALVGQRRWGEATEALDGLARDGWHPALVAYWRSEVASGSGNPAGALVSSLDAVRDRALGESDWPLVRQVARMARRARSPGVALPIVLEWLGQFPDVQESGPVWLDACVNATRAGGPGVARAEGYHARARRLLGDLPAVRTYRPRVGV